jgi:iron complex outermembrane receptor protein
LDHVLEAAIWRCRSTLTACCFDIFQQQQVNDSRWCSVNADKRTGTLGAMLLSSAVSLVIADAAQAQQQEVLQIPEMLVTSRAREEALRDVPISLSLVSGDMIDATGIENLEDLSAVVPNFSVTQDPIGDKINIRGIFTSEVPSLEQSVSTFVDGVNRGRGTQSRLQFLDLERVEVLRGPQGTLFGKNTVGGALNLTTRKPTAQLAGTFQAAYDPELEETTLAGFLSGPLSQTVRGRLAFAGSDQREGFIDNRFYRDSEPTSEDISVRGTLEWDLSSMTLLRVRAEYQDFDVEGQSFGLRTAGPLTPLLQAYGVKGGSLTQTAIGQTPGALFDIGSSGTMDGDAQELALTLKQDFAAGGSLEIVGAFSGLDFKRQVDADFSPLDLVGFEDTEDYEQTSLSVRFLSADKGRVRYVAGLYYQQVDLQLNGLTSFNPTAATPVLAPLCQAAGLTPNDALLLSFASVGFMGVTPANVASQLARAGSAAAVESCVTFGAILALPQPVARVNSFDQDGEMTAVYGQADFDLTSNLQLTLGLRYTIETKEARQAVFGSNFGTRTPNPALNLNLLTFLEATPHAFGTDQLDRRESKLTYSASLQWAVTDDVNAYVSASSGFKAGGFNSGALGPSPDQAEFAPEEVMSYELGVKTSVFDGRAQLNAAYFFTQIEDLQVAQFTGDASFIVQNAAEAEVQGLELDGRFQITKNLVVTTAAAYTDFEFTSFRNAGCTVQQLQALRQASYDQGTALLRDANPANDAAGYTAQLLGSFQGLRECSALGLNDLKGRTAEQVPELTAQLGVDYHLELGRGRFAVDAIAELAWNDRQYRQTDLDPATESSSFAKTNLSLSFYRPGTPWTLMLIGRNIFDKRTFSYANDAPLLDNVRQQIIDKPRTVRLQLQYDFR